MTTSQAQVANERKLQNQDHKPKSEDQNHRGSSNGNSKNNKNVGNKRQRKSEKNGNNSRPQRNNKATQRRNAQDQHRTSAYQLAVLPESAKYFAEEEFNTPLRVGVALQIHTNDIKSWLNERYHRFANFYGYGVGGLVRAGVGSQVRRYDEYINRVLMQSEFILNNTLAITQPIIDEYLEQFSCETLGGNKEVREIYFSNHFHLRYLRILEQLDLLLTHINFLCLVGHIDTPAKLSMYHQWARLPRKIEQKLIMLNKGIEEEFKCKLTGKGRTEGLVLPEDKLRNFVDNFAEKYASVTNRHFELSIVTPTQNQIDNKKIDHLSYQFYMEYTKQNEESNSKDQSGQGENKSFAVSAINSRLKDL
ncbi:MULTISPECIES: hypothetical protein [Vibrio]|uniref:hypothetical protein n=1 Tax=Vibrio TaxID=662 RepID=UPI00078E71A4|nr:MULTISPECIES: hypothetical protein [Vibrio]BAU70808.1 hypothetical protein [Vibrio sp. 04Ya108]BBM67624.1 hypothetical protein VA249_42700 [Vibrio alfacsensis]BCN27106.1 hypothetical protein VYA_42980 [Vibrio alfacsensis]